MQPSFDPPDATQGAASNRSMSAGWNGALVGLEPLALLIVLAAATVGLTLLARLASAGQGFAVEQYVVAAVFGVGLIVTATVYIILCVRVVRRVRGWQRAGEAAQAAGALWALGLTALVVVIPVVVALVFPQHPSP